MKFEKFDEEEESDNLDEELDDIFGDEEV